MEKKNKFHLRLRTNDPSNFSLVHERVNEIWGKNSVHVVSLPRKIKRFTVQRSHHVHKKSRDQLEIISSSRLWVLEGVTTKKHTQLDKIKNICASIPGLSMDWKLLFEEHIQSKVISLCFKK